MWDAYCYSPKPNEKRSSSIEDHKCEERKWWWCWWWSRGRHCRLVPPLATAVSISLSFQQMPSPPLSVWSLSDLHDVSEFAFFSFLFLFLMINVFFVNFVYDFEFEYVILWYNFYSFSNSRGNATCTINVFSQQILQFCQSCYWFSTESTTNTTLLSTIYG